MQVRWVNYHLSKTTCEKRLSNFATDLRDCIIYTHLMARICPDHCNLEPLNEPDAKKRAVMTLQSAERMGCAKFVRARDIVSGNKDLNLAFTAVLSLSQNDSLSMRQHTSAYVSIRQHMSAYVSIRQHTSAYVNVSIREHT
jgi:hypothetical protein